MADQPNRYILPGRRANHSSYFKTNLARAFAASHATNPRNLEYYWYAPWYQIWTDLVHDLQSMFVETQAPLWYRLPLDDTADEDDGSEFGNFTLESIAATLSARRRHEVIPDFLIVRVLADWRDPSAGHIPKNLKIRYAGVPVLIENKRAPSRTDIYHQEALREIRLNIGQAIFDLMVDAPVLFEMFPLQSSTVLVACAGPWWAYREVTKETFHSAESQVPSSPDVYLEEMEEDDQEEFDAGDANGPYMDETDLARLGTSAEEYATPEIKSLIQNWGSIFLLESRVSDLEFQNLHRHLVNVRDMAYEVTRG